MLLLFAYQERKKKIRKETDIDLSNVLPYPTRNKKCAEVFDRQI